MIRHSWNKFETCEACGISRIQTWEHGRVQVTYYSAQGDILKRRPECIKQPEQTLKLFDVPATNVQLGALAKRTETNKKTYSFNFKDTYGLTHTGYKLLANDLKDFFNVFKKRYIRNNVTEVFLNGVQVYPKLINDQNNKT